MPTLTSIRAAAVLYVALVVVGLVGLILIPLQFVVSGDGAATLANVRAMQPLFRFGILAELAGNALFVAVAVALYRVFKPVDTELAAAMFILAALEVPLAFAASAADLGALSLVSGATRLAPGVDVDAIAYVLIRLHSQLLVTAAIFWGLWLIPLAVLELRSGFVPRVVGIVVLVAAFGYLFDVVIAIALPDLPGLRGVTSAAQVGELGTIVWLIARSVRPFRSGASVAPVGALG